jgi:hypothetical protein
MEDLKNMQGYLKRIHRGILEMSPHNPRRIAAYAALIATIVAVVPCGDFESTKSLAPTAAQAISPSQTAQPIPTTVTPTTEPLTTEPPPAYSYHRADRHPTRGYPNASVRHPDSGTDLHATSTSHRECSLRASRRALGRSTWLRFHLANRRSG